MLITLVLQSNSAGSVLINDGTVGAEIRELKHGVAAPVIRAGHRKFKLNSATANSAKLQEVFRNRKSASLR